MNGLANTLSSSVALEWALTLFIACTILAMVLTAWRLVKGPTAPDKILALDTLFLCGAALIVALGLRFQTTLHFEVALLVAMLGFISTVGLARFIARGDVIE
jgi:multicomponent K+:H+ antiporter subunit F